MNVRTPKDTVIHIRMTSGFKKALDETADALSMTTTEYITYVIRKDMERRDALKRQEQAQKK